MCLALLKPAYIVYKILYISKNQPVIIKICSALVNIYWRNKNKLSAWFIKYPAPIKNKVQHVKFKT